MTSFVTEGVSSALKSTVSDAGVVGRRWRLPVREHPVDVPQVSLLLLGVIAELGEEIRRCLCAILFASVLLAQFHLRPYYCLAVSDGTVVRGHQHAFCLFLNFRRRIRVACLYG